MLRHTTTNRLLLALAMAIFLLAAKPGHAVAEESRALSVWEYAFYKTITYEIAAGIVDIPLYRLLLGGTVVTAGAFALVNTSTGIGTYFGHEVLWELYGPPMQADPETALEVGKAKVATFWAVSTVRNFALAYAFTGAASASIVFSLVSNAVDAVIYAGNEYGWYAYGPRLELVPTGAGISPARTVLPRWREPDDEIASGSMAVSDAAAGMPDGSLLVGDDTGKTIQRVSRVGN